MYFDQKQNWMHLQVEEAKEIVSKLMAIYKNYGHPKWLQNPQMEFSCIIGSKMPFSSENFKIQGMVNRKIKDVAPQVYKELCKELEKIDATVEIGVSYGVGDSIEMLSKLTGKSGDTYVRHEAGKVMLIDFWSGQACQSRLACYQEWKENKSWGSNVRIVALSTDHAKVDDRCLLEHFHCGEQATVHKQFNV